MGAGKGDDYLVVGVSVQLLDAGQKPLVYGDRRGRATPLRGAVMDHIEALEARQGATNTALVRIRRAQGHELAQPHPVVTNACPPRGQQVDNRIENFGGHPAQSRGPAGLGHPERDQIGAVIADTRALFIAGAVRF
jgi:hypothetical protein